MLVGWNKGSFSTSVDMTNRKLVRTAIITSRGKKNRDMNMFYTFDLLLTLQVASVYFCNKQCFEASSLISQGLLKSGSNMKGQQAWPSH